MSNFREKLEYTFNNLRVGDIYPSFKDLVRDVDHRPLSEEVYKEVSSLYEIRKDKNGIITEIQERLF